MCAHERAKYSITCSRNIIEGNTLLLLKLFQWAFTNYTSEKILLNLCSQRAMAIIHCTVLTLKLLFFSDKIMSAKV